ncbi:hypothetical protein C7999DRAFT_15085 [Corynascus novoguineensis]|uniref:Uncharacterized protein n=1 Tax=Corynascus novoguineensis TaxID=1126955 RepID=A0AAN7CS32_9PEZI|nr:hypothetical protein C7999DRAFT_15085 [Corynascus novoguineensis]
MKFSAIVSAGVAVLGLVNAAALPKEKDRAMKRDSTVDSFDNSAWWGKKKRVSTVENFDNSAWWGKKRDSTVENFDNPAWLGKKEEDNRGRRGGRGLDLVLRLRLATSTPRSRELVIVGNRGST